MPGGYLSFGVYQALGGERSFGEFWSQLGFPTILLVATCYFALVHHAVVSQRAWLIASVGWIVLMAIAIFLRTIR